jgi:protein involved in polysaccharide export with SLBB domain
MPQGPATWVAATLDFLKKDSILLTYSVDRHGNIRLPYLGDINVLGYTTPEVTEKIESKFQVYFKNPEDVFVTVQVGRNKGHY